MKLVSIRRKKGKRKSEEIKIKIKIRKKPETFEDHHLVHVVVVLHRVVEGQKINKK